MSRKEVILLVILALSVVSCASPEESQGNAPAAQPAPEVKDQGGRTPLMRAIDSVDIEGARKLIADGANVNAETLSGVTPLMNAAGIGRKNVEMIIARART